MERLDFPDRDLIVPANDDFGAHFTQILHQVVGERVVIVEDKDHLFSLNHRKAGHGFPRILTDSGTTAGNLGWVETRADPCQSVTILSASAGYCPKFRLTGGW